MTAPNALSANRYPYPKEEALLRAHITSAEDERQLLENRRRESALVVDTARRDVEAAERVLEAAREALESAQALHDGVSESCRALDARVDLARRRLHPIRRVPDDVFGEIFRYVVDAANEDLKASNYRAAQKVPFTLARVSRRWRAAALAQPRLWQYLNLDLDVIASGLRRLRLFDPNCRDCKWCRFIQAYHSRSKSISIHLRLVRQTGDYQVHLCHIWEHLQEIAPRIRLLEIQHGGDATGDLEEFLGQPMPVLETALVDATQHSEPLWSQPIDCPLFVSAPRLSTCRLRHLHPKWTSDAQIYAALSALDFSGGTRPDEDAPSVSQISDLLSRCPVLEHVKIHLAYLQVDDPPAPQRMFPRVKDVTIRISKLDADDLVNSLVFPSAERVEVSLSAQATRTLIGTCASTLKTLFIHTRSINAPIATLLKEAVALEFVEFARCKLTEVFFRQMATPLPNGTIACPAWSGLAITDCSASAQDRFTGQALLDLLRLRTDRFGKDGSVQRLSDVVVSWSSKAAVPLVDEFAERLQTLLQ